MLAASYTSPAPGKNYGPRLGCLSPPGSRQLGQRRGTQQIIKGEFQQPPPRISFKRHVRDLHVPAAPAASTSARASRMRIDLQLLACLTVLNASLTMRDRCRGRQFYSLGRYCAQGVARPGRGPSGAAAPQPWPPPAQPPASSSCLQSEARPTRRAGARGCRVPRRCAAPGSVASPSCSSAAAAGAAAPRAPHPPPRPAAPPASAAQPWPPAAAGARQGEAGRGREGGGGSAGVFRVLG